MTRIALNLVIYLIICKLEPVESIPNLALKGESKMYFSNESCVFENINGDENEYKLYKYSTIDEENSIKVYKALGNVNYKKDVLSKIENCLIYNENEICTSDVLHKVQITTDEEKYYLYAGGPETCAVLVASTVPEQTKMEEILDLLLTEDEMSPAIRYSDRRNNIN